MKKNGIVVALLLLVSGCVSTSWIPYYKDLEPVYDQKYKLRSPLVVAVQDQRPYVLSGDKKENFYGLSRSLYGIPYSVYGPVSASSDILEYVYLLLDDGSTRYAIQKVELDIKKNGFDDLVSRNIGKPVLFIKVLQWKTDVPAIGTGALKYSLKALVLDGGGSVVAEKDIEGNEPMTNPDPESDSNLKTGRWHQKVKGDALGKILLDANIVNSINAFGGSNEQITTQNIPETDTASVDSQNENTVSCTTEQVLSMKSSGLTDEQITAACK